MLNFNVDVTKILPYYFAKNNIKLKNGNGYYYLNPAGNGLILKNGSKGNANQYSSEINRTVLVNGKNSGNLEADNDKVKTNVDSFLLDSGFDEADRVMLANVFCEQNLLQFSNDCVSSDNGGMYADSFSNFTFNLKKGKFSDNLPSEEKDIHNIYKLEEKEKEKEIFLESKFTLKVKFVLEVKDESNKIVMQYKFLHFPGFITAKWKLSNDSATLMDLTTDNYFLKTVVEQSVKVPKNFEELLQDYYDADFIYAATEITGKSILEKLRNLEARKHVFMCDRVIILSNLISSNISKNEREVIDDKEKDRRISRLTKVQYRLTHAARGEMDYAKVVTNSIKAADGKTIDKNKLRDVVAQDTSGTFLKKVFSVHSVFSNRDVLKTLNKNENVIIRGQIVNELLDNLGNAIKLGDSDAQNRIAAVVAKYFDKGFRKVYEDEKAFFSQMQESRFKALLYADSVRARPCLDWNFVETFIKDEYEKNIETMDVSHPFDIKSLVPDRALQFHPLFTPKRLCQLALDCNNVDLAVAALKKNGNVLSKRDNGVHLNQQDVINLVNKFCENKKVLDEIKKAQGGFLGLFQTSLYDKLYSVSKQKIDSATQMTTQKPIAGATGGGTTGAVQNSLGSTNSETEKSVDVFSALKNVKSEMQKITSKLDDLAKHYNYAMYKIGDSIYLTIFNPKDPGLGLKRHKLGKEDLKKLDFVENCRQLKENAVVDLSDKQKSIEKWSKSLENQDVLTQPVAEIGMHH
jgi:hypothetical protein